MGGGEFGFSFISFTIHFCFLLIISLTIHFYFLLIFMDGIVISFVGICDLVCEEQKVQINQHQLNSNQKQASWFKIPPAPFESISCCDDGKCGGILGGTTVSQM